jgi:hypothetical protein
MVEGLDPKFFCFFKLVRYLKLSCFFYFKKRDQSVNFVLIFDSVKILVKVPIPTSSQSMGLIFSWSESDSKSILMLCPFEVDEIDIDRMRV